MPDSRARLARWSARADAAMQPTPPGFSRPLTDAAPPVARCRQVVKELKELGFSDDDLEAAGFTRRAIEAVDGRSVQELREQGGYAVAELKEYGFMAAELRGVYTIKDMKDQGFSLEELREGGMPEHAVLAVDGRSTR